MRDPNPTLPLRLICDEVSPPLDLYGPDGVEVDDPPDVVFRCQRPTHHGGDHSISLTWSRDPQLIAVYPWRVE